MSIGGVEAVVQAVGIGSAYVNVVGVVEEVKASASTSTSSGRAVRCGQDTTVGRLVDWADLGDLGK